MLLIAAGGDIAQGVALAGLYSAAFPAPGNGVREFIRFEDGAEFGYDPESHAADVSLPEGGTLAIHAAGGVIVNARGGVVIDASDGVSIDGDVTVTGAIAASGDITASGDVKAGGVSLKNHRHAGVQAGGGTTGPAQ